MDHEMTYGFVRVLDDLSGVVLQHKSTSKPFKKVFEESITQLIDENGTNLSVMFSGGADSELVIRELVRQGASVCAHTVRHAYGLNSQDYDAASEVAKSLNIKHVVHDVDIIAGATSLEFEEKAVRYRANDLSVIAMIDPAKSIDTPVIYGHTPSIDFRGDGTLPMENFYWQLEMNDHSDLIGARLISEGHQIVQFGACYTPELFHAWLHHPVLEKTFKPGSNKLSIESSKNLMYRESGLSFTAKRKFRGFEKFYWVAAAWRRDHDYLNRTVCIEIDLLKNKKDNETTVINRPHSSRVSGS